MQLRLAISRYKDSLRRVPALKTKEDALRYNQLNLAWTSVHGALCLSWLKEEVDAFPTARPDLPEKIIEGATRVLTHIKLGQAAGDPTLGELLFELPHPGWEMCRGEQRLSIRVLRHARECRMGRSGTDAGQICSRPC